ncbi:hypothetical protein V6N12_054843 [Hibiscus sabdariffa]|uniref:Uncharacterized protein n=1 Tax=Hibiscus sabdariffa TaxID=183260 RepID=A0ABR2D2F1_9ROSI
MHWRSLVYVRVIRLEFICFLLMSSYLSLNQFSVIKSLPTGPHFPPFFLPIFSPQAQVSFESKPWPLDSYFLELRKLCSTTTNNFPFNACSILILLAGGKHRLLLGLLILVLRDFRNSSLVKRKLRSQYILRNELKLFSSVSIYRSILPFFGY